MAPPSSPASRPLAAAVGLAVLGAQKAKDLPGRAVLASLSGVGAALSLPGILRREYDQLAAQGERVLARLNGQVEPDLPPAAGETGAGSGDGTTDEWIARPVFPAPPSAGAPVFPAPPSAAPVFPAPPVAAPVFPAPPTGPAPAGPGTVRVTVEEPTAADAAAADPDADADADADAGGAAPLGDPDAAGVTVVSEAAGVTLLTEAGTETDTGTGAGTGTGTGTDTGTAPILTAPDTAPDPTAHLDAVALLVQDASEAVRAGDLPPGGDLQAGQLPLEDFDHLTLGSLRGRLRRLSVAELVQLREYELAHGHRLPILSMLDNRIAKLEAERAAAAG